VHAILHELARRMRSAEEMANDAFTDCMQRRSDKRACERESVSPRDLSETLARLRRVGVRL
jgi:hypothetical protein